MTIGEAIEYIQEWLKDEDALNFGDREALNIAIDALQEQEGKKENYPEYLKAAATLLKVNCSKTQYCSMCLFRVEYADQGGGSFCGCKLEHGCADFSMKCRPENWEV
jgi:hypothetical protein